MPFGAECDMYSIMGEILAVRERINRMTGVRLYQMRLNVNERHLMSRSGRFRDGRAGDRKTVQRYNLAAGIYYF